MGRVRSQANQALPGTRLSIREFGVAGDPSDIIFKCETCQRDRRMADAFDTDEFGIQCRGHHPHLRMNDPHGCDQPARTILLGASNSWFPMVMSALTIPRAADKLGQLVEKHWVKLKDLPSLEVAKWALLPQNFPAFIGFPVEQVSAAIQAKRAGANAGVAEPADLKLPEWELLANTTPLPATDEFRTRRVAAPLGYDHLFGTATSTATPCSKRSPPRPPHFSPKDEPLRAGVLICGYENRPSLEC